jgi:hypothetical protein
MGGRPDGGGETRPPWASLFDPVANAQAFADVQAQGLRAASELIERLARSVDGDESAPTEATADKGGEQDGESATAPSSDAARLIEVWIELLQRASTSFARTSGRSASNPRLEIDLETGSGPSRLRLDVDSAGSLTAGPAEVWLHNGTPAALGPLALRCGDLCAPDGETLAAELVCDPTALAELPARSSRGVALTVVKNGELRAGTYRGLIQVDGAPKVWLPVEIGVTGAPS